MHFTSGINRPPFEANSGFLQVTSGCSHASCAFCTYYKDSSFKKPLLAEIEEDVKQIPHYFGAPKRIFLQGADGFAADYDILMKTAELIHTYVPSVETIGGYARIDNFVDKTEEEIKNLVAMGYADPYIGIESGDDRVLTRVHKGYTADLAREQLEKLTAAGMPMITNFLNGLGGADYGLDHALKTAKLYEDMNISMIELASLTVVPKTILYRQREEGTFREASEHERLRELQAFVTALTNERTLLAVHASVPFNVRAQLPEQKKEVIEGIQSIIDGRSEEELRIYRDHVVSCFRSN